jgi:hypothetical protein
MILEIHQTHLHVSLGLLLLAQLMVWSKVGDIGGYLLGSGAGILVFKISMIYLPQIWPL